MLSKTFPRGAAPLLVLAAGLLVVLGLVLYAPGLFSRHGSGNASASEDDDPNRLVVVPVEEPMDKGQVLADGQWADGGKEGIRQHDLFMRVDATTVGGLPEKPGKYVIVNFRLNQVRWEKANAFGGFTGTNRPKLTDETGRSYPFLLNRPRKPFGTRFDQGLNIDHLLVFELPPSTGGPDGTPAKIDSLKLEVPAAAWGRQGACRLLIKNIEMEAPPDLPKLIGQYKTMLRRPPQTPPDTALGRMLFNKTCMECHTLYGIGAKVGPELTDRKFPDGRLKRHDLDFLVTSIVDPSAEIDKEYQPSIVNTVSGLVFVGIVKETTDKGVKLQTASKPVFVPKKDIEDIRESKVSLMPTELLKTFDEHQVRSLLAYLSGANQAPLLASHENAIYFSTAPGVGRTEVVQDPLTFWDNPGARWKIDQGEMVCSGQEASPAALLVSHLLVADEFNVTLQFNPGKQGQGAFHVRDEQKPGLPPTGLRLEFAAGGLPTLTATEDGRPVAPGKAVVGTATVKPSAWNKLEITATGTRVQVRLNGKDVGELDAKPARHGLAVEALVAAGDELRFRNLDLRLLSPHVRSNP
jgi:putative heme-binding domain-containing protein